VGDDEGRIAIIIEGEISFVQAHQAGIKKIAFDEALGVLVTLSYDRTVAIWNVSGARELHEVARTEFPAMVWARAAVLNRPFRVALGTFGSSFCVFDWKANTWDTDGIVVGNGLNAIAVVDDVQYAIGDAGRIFRDGQPFTQLGSLCNFLLAADGRLFSGGQLGHLFDAHTGASLYQHHSPLNCGTSFLRDGKRHILIGTYTGKALVFILEADARPRLVEILKIYKNAIKGVVATEDRLFSVCASTSVARHDIANFKLVRLVPNAHERIANGCCLAGPSGFASVGRDLKLRIWTGNQEEVYRTPHPNSVKCICASDDRATLMTGSYTGTVAGFDMASRSWVSFNRPSPSGISALAYHSRDRHFLASSYDGHVYAVA
jgi:WD40 repeat protein